MTQHIPHKQTTLTAAIILAAGQGTRAGGPCAKQWRSLNGFPVIHHAIQAFHTHPGISQLILVLPEEQTEQRYAQSLLQQMPYNSSLCYITGRNSRQASVHAGLRALKENIENVLIHDGARPCVSHQLITRVLAGLHGAQAAAAAPALAVTDTLWTGDTQHVIGTQSRDGLYRAQTPQAFNRVALLKAHQNATDGATDDVMVAKAAGLDVHIVEGDEDNIKITGPNDHNRAAHILQRQNCTLPLPLKTQGHAMDIRVGNGYDVHRFTAGDHLFLCGVKIPFTQSLEGHSDADVALHTITDAIYGALAEGDIGRHFPPSDPQWKGAASDIFLKHACALAQEKGYTISNIDCTIVCELPKIGPHAQGMRDSLSQIMQLDLSRISVKATTSERLGFTGRKEGIAALATASLIKP